MKAAAHRAFEVRDASQPGEVRRAAVQLAREAGFDDVAAGRVALAATELGSNLVKNAQQGVLLVAADQADDGSPIV